MVDERYARFADLWAEVCRPRPCGVTGTCREAVDLMLRQFPELKAVRGHALMLDASPHERKEWPHWWCVTEDGTIVDPTASQFPGRIQHVPLDESKGEPTGRCPNCGGLCYEHKYLCCEKCETEYAVYCGG